MPPRIGASPTSPGAFSSSTVTFFVCDASSSTMRARGSRASRDSIRSFSQTPHVAARKRQTRQRRDFFEWLHGPGLNFRIPLPNSTNYLGAYDATGVHKSAQISDEDLDEGEVKKKPPSADEFRPFPMNKQFKSLPVLSEPFREAIYDKIVNRGMSVREVSVHLGVSMERVGAVVRLKEVEKRWESEGQKLVTPYADAVMAMLPQTLFRTRGSNHHESILDLPVHPFTKQQIFYPVSESRKFTRKDAAKVFNPALLPADQRVPHPQLIVKERMKAEQWSEEQKDKYYAKQAKREAAKAKAESEAKQKAAEQTQVIEGRRWDFRVQDINVSVESTGMDGRNPSAVGSRYGFPHEDRKRGQVKIPTRVD